jgi:hypothetical protein
MFAAGELSSTDADLAQQLHEALNDPMRHLPLSALAMFTTVFLVAEVLPSTLRSMMMPGLWATTPNRRNGP